MKKNRHSRSVKVISDHVLDELIENEKPKTSSAPVKEAVGEPVTVTEAQVETPAPPEMNEQNNYANAVRQMSTAPITSISQMLNYHRSCSSLSPKYSRPSEALFRFKSKSFVDFSSSPY